MWHAAAGNAECVGRLLEEQEVAATVNAVVNVRGMDFTALRFVSERLDLEQDRRARIVELLLRAGAHPIMPVNPDSTDFIQRGLELLCLGEDPGYGCLSEAELLVLVEDNPGSLNARDRQGDTVLKVAVEKNFTDLASWLLHSKGVNLHSHLPTSQTHLHLAKNEYIVSLLLNRGVDPMVPLDDGRTLLMWHAEAGRFGCIKHLLKDNRVRSTINATVQTDLGRLTALHYVCLNVWWNPPTRYELVRILLTAGADLECGYPPLTSLVVERLNVVDGAWIGQIAKLVQSPYRPEDKFSFDSMNEAGMWIWIARNPLRLFKRDNNGNMLINVAVEKGYAALVTHLIDDKMMGVHGHVKPPRNLLHLDKKGKVTAALVDRGLDPTVNFEDGTTLLMWHVQYCHLDAIKFLLQDARVLAKINATANHRDETCTALHFLRSPYGRTPSRDTDSANVLKLLLRAGLDVTLGCSPFLAKWRPLPRSKFDKQFPIEILNVLEPAWRQRVCALLIKVCRIVNINLSIAHAAPEQMDEVEKYFKRVLAAPSQLKNRMQKDQALPEVVMMQPPSDIDEGPRLRRMLSFVVCLGEVDGKTLPGDVFKLMMDMLLARWDPLRGGNCGREVEECFLKHAEAPRAHSFFKAPTPPHQLNPGSPWSLRAETAPLRPLNRNDFPWGQPPTAPVAPHDQHLVVAPPLILASPPLPPINFDFLLSQQSGPPVASSHHQVVAVPLIFHPPPPPPPPRPLSPTLPHAQQAEAL